MLIKIDTKERSISIEEVLTFEQLEHTLKTLFPTDYKEWKINTNVKVELTSSPIIIRERPRYPDWWNNPYWYSTAEVKSVPSLLCDGVSTTTMVGGTSTVTNASIPSSVVVDYAPDSNAK